MPPMAFAPPPPTTTSEMRSSATTIKAVAADWVARRDAGLSRAESAELQAWLDADRRHRDALAELDSAWGALDRPYQAGAAADLLNAVKTRVRRRRLRAVTFGTGLAVVVMIGFLWRSETGPAFNSLQSSRSGTATVVLPSRQTLPDSSVVELNSNAEIVTDFQPNLRRVVLQKGEAHFQVASDASRPFVVVVGNVEVRAVGTAFSVQRGQAKVEVLVTEGRVAVERVAGTTAQPLEDGGRENAETLESRISASPRLRVSASSSPAPVVAPVFLGPGYRAVVGFSSTDQAPPEVEFLAAADLSERLAWRAPRLEFSGTPLSEAVDLLNEHADRAAAAAQPSLRYAIGDPEIAPMRVSGLFRVDNTESFVRLLKHGFGIEAEKRDGSDVIVLRKAR